MTISSLSQATILSPNYSNTRVNVSKITVHHMAGNLDIWTCGSVFQPVSRQASSNYGIDSEGRIACYVPEEYRSWCSASAWNDNRAITIEVANTSAGCYDGTWAISNKAWNALVELCADICKRYGFELVFTGDSSGSLTRHNFYASTNCPGPWIEAHTKELCEKVNAKVRGEDDDMPLTDRDIQRIWEYTYQYGTENEDSTLGKRGVDTNMISNRYNVLNFGTIASRASEQKLKELDAKIDDIAGKIEKIEVGNVDYDMLAKAVANEIFTRMKE